jgi:hypothetical protein
VITLHPHFGNRYPYVLNSGSSVNNRARMYYLDTEGLYD